MIWHITKRELYDNLNSLRFALTTVLLFVLMLMNAIIHVQEHPERMTKYSDATTASVNTLRSRTDLFSVAQEGPGNLYKKPSPLYFCEEGGDIFLTNYVYGATTVQIDNNLRAFWSLYYPGAFPNVFNLRPDTVKVDWGFVIGYVLSLITILFTFDSISGERERGTLRLMLSNSVPRHTVLMGKFLGALASISVPFTLATLMNLSVIYVSKDVDLGADAWIRLVIIFSIAILYLCLFIALGLLVSSSVQNSVTSLVILLLTWCVFVIFIPSTIPSMASGFSTNPMTYDEFFKRRHQNIKELKEEYAALSQEMRGFPDKKIQIDGEYVSKGTAQEERLSQEQLSQQINQIQLARSVTRISPATLMQHLLEAFAGTGFERHQQFLENVKHYAREYREFITDMDRADPESLHIIGVREGMSQKPVNPETIPTFEDKLSISRDFNATAIDLFLLILFFVVLMSATYLRFISIEI